jgi:hypothetical protein
MLHSLEKKKEGQKMGKETDLTYVQILIVSASLNSSAGYIAWHRGDGIEWQHNFRSSKTTYQHCRWVHILSTSQPSVT